MEIQILSSSEKKHLRGKAQRLEDKVSVGKQGLTAAVIQEFNTALKHNGLVKVRFHAERSVMEEQIAALCQETLAQLVGSVGKTASFYRPAQA
ncbi:MAG TPA: YhbY family RNA-binding protein [Opitutales bacterium]|nr:YhbY family RNA-binding protein [Opitutales bacterium]